MGPDIYIAQLEADLRKPEEGSASKPLEGVKGEVVQGIKNTLTPDNPQHFLGLGRGVLPGDSIHSSAQPSDIPAPRSYQDIDPDAADSWC